MSEKSPNGDYQGGNLPSEHPDHSSYLKYQKSLEQKIENLLEKMGEIKDEHPYEDYTKFETSTKIPSYIELVSTFKF